MASIVDGHGIQMEVEGALDPSIEQLSRLRDMIIIKLRKRGLSFDAIGRVVGLKREGVRTRYYDTPEEVRDHYGSIQLG